MIRLLILISALTFVVACGDDPEPVGIDCATTALSYDNFGSGFMTNYCTECHSATADNRRAAPASVNFDTQDEIKALSDRVLLRAGSGATMPPNSVSSLPSASERAMLEEWVECGML